MVWLESLGVLNATVGSLRYVHGIATAPLVSREPEGGKTSKGRKGNSTVRDAMDVVEFFGPDASAKQEMFRLVMLVFVLGLMVVAGFLVHAIATKSTNAITYAMVFLGFKDPPSPDDAFIFYDVNGREVPADSPDAVRVDRRPVTTSWTEYLLYVVIGLICLFLVLSVVREFMVYHPGTMLESFFRRSYTKEEGDALDAKGLETKGLAENLTNINRAMVGAYKEVAAEEADAAKAAEAKLNAMEIDDTEKKTVWYFQPDVR